MAVPDKPVTALEHYEKAVENETAGRLGESLRLYRKAFRMDEAVDQLYRVKHFPRGAAKQSGGGKVEGVGSGKGVESGRGKEKEGAMTMRELIASFAGLGIEAVPPPVEGMEQPKCLLGELPEEILVQILGEVAGEDVGDFVRLAQVCKRLAFLVATEDRIWRRICLGKEFGFGGMHYRWQRQVSWGRLTEQEMLRDDEERDGEDAEDGEGEVAWVIGEQQGAQRQAEENKAVTLAFYRSLYSSSWQRMFRLRPRIRFNGCYISTNNYIRPGMANANTITWNSPVHIVTYYRFLRFFRDGTALSLQTTADPADVVHHLAKRPPFTRAARSPISPVLSSSLSYAAAGVLPARGITRTPRSARWKGMSLLRRRAYPTIFIGWICRCDRLGKWSVGHATISWCGGGSIATTD